MPKATRTKEADVDKLRLKVSAGKRPTKAKCTTALAALELTKGEKREDALKRRKLKWS